MSSFEQRLWMARRSAVGQWAGGTFKALATLALSALLIWIAVTVVNDSGLLRPTAPAHHSPADGSHFPRTAYG